MYVRPPLRSSGENPLVTTQPRGPSGRPLFRAPRRAEGAFRRPPAPYQPSLGRPPSALSLEEPAGGGLRLRRHDPRTGESAPRTVRRAERPAPPEATAAPSPPPGENLAGLVHFLRALVSTFQRLATAVAALVTPLGQLLATILALVELFDTLRRRLTGEPESATEPEDTTTTPAAEETELELPRRQWEPEPDEAEQLSPRPDEVEESSAESCACACTCACAA